MNENKNKLAFPSNEAMEKTDPRNGLTGGGLTKREHFAGLAMQGILANNKLRSALLSDQKVDGTNSDNCVAVFAVKMADELLNQLK